PTATMPRSESDTVAAPAFTLAIEVWSWSCAVASCARAAASLSRAASAALYACLTLNEMLNSVLIWFACCCATLDCCVRTSARVRPPSYTVIADCNDVVYAHFEAIGIRLLLGPRRSPWLILWFVLADKLGYHSARAERTLLFASRTEFAAVMFETLFSVANRSASASEIVWNVVSVICCAPSIIGAASSETTISFLRMFSWAPWTARHRAEPWFPCDVHPASRVVPR